MHVGSLSLSSTCSVLMAPVPYEACAAGQGVLPPPGQACWARRGIPANRSRCTAEAAVRSVPLPPCGEACHPSLGQGVPPPPGESKRRRRRFYGVPPHAQSLSTRFQATVWSTSPSVADRMTCHLLLHCRLVDFNLLTTEYSWLHRGAIQSIWQQALVTLC